MKEHLRALGCLLLLVLSITPVIALEPFRDDDLGITFPEKLGKLTLQAREQYDQPELGYSLRYQDDKLFKVDLYIYDGGRKGIGDGITGEAVQEEFGDVLQVFPAMQKMGRYTDVKELKNGEAMFGTPPKPFLWARYEYRQAPGKDTAFEGLRYSDTFLVAHRDKFVKVRLTIPEPEFKDREGEIEIFLTGLAALLQGSAPPSPPAPAGN